MKQLKSSIEDVREIFEKGIKVSHITEPFCSFDESAIATDVKRFLDEKQYDVVGVRTNGIINGYAYSSDLAKGQIIKYLKKFDQRELLSDTASITEALKMMTNSNHIFVLSFGSVAGIITRGDLQKIPIRMWLFSLISLIEMQMLRIIRKRYPGKSWEELIHPDRYKKVEEYFINLKKKNEEIELVDCLQFCDKREIILKTEDILEKLKCSKTKFCELLEDLENLRNNLDHAQNMITDGWSSIIKLSKEAEELLEKFEKLNLPIDNLSMK
jgi:CBS domain-containing protein